MREVIEGVPVPGALDERMREREAPVHVLGLLLDRTTKRLDRLVRLALAQKRPPLAQERVGRWSE